MKREHVNECPFIAGRVERYHGWPTINTETVDAHTLGVLRIYLELFGDPPGNVLTCIVYHDYGEQWAGDIPFGGKLSVPGLKALHAEAEEEGLAKLGIGRLPTLSPEASMRIKLCDLLQMYEFGKYEAQMGSRYALPVVEATSNAALHVARELCITVKTENWMKSGRRP